MKALEDPHDADTFGVVGGIIDVTPDDVARLAHTPLPDGRIALDILPEHHDGATVVVSTGCRHGTTWLYNALDNVIGDMEAIDDEMREASAGGTASE